MTMGLSKNLQLTINILLLHIKGKNFFLGDQLFVEFYQKIAFIVILLGGLDKRLMSSLGSLEFSAENPSLSGNFYEVT